MPTLDPKYNRWVRTCQSCGNTRKYRSPKLYTDDRWKDTICKVCKSPDLDYGREAREDEIK